MVGARPLSQFLRLAVIAGVESAVQIHIERGDDLNARDARGMTPLMLSAARNKPEVCKLLLSAGADYSLLAPSGKTALEIAVAAGAEATAAILTAVSAPIPSLSPSDIALDAARNPVLESYHPDIPISAGRTRAASDGGANSPNSETTAAPSALVQASLTSSVVDEIEDGEFDLASWEAEDEPTRPEHDTVVVESASAVQTSITAHAPIDSSAEWDDVDVQLPEFALPLARVDDLESRTQLRHLLLRAIREGSVPNLDVQALSANEDRSNNPGAEAFLAMVINDLGAEVDERFEYSGADESFEVTIDPEETSDEEALLDEALAAFDRAASPRHEPLQIYQREFQRLPLLTAEEEIQLAKDMEAALDDALDALAGWKDGIARTLAAGMEAIAGLRPLSSISVGGAEPELEPASADEPEADTPEGPGNSVDEDAEPEGDVEMEAVGSAFADALHHLAALANADTDIEASPSAVRQALAALRLDRRFLLELVDAAHRAEACAKFRRAMSNFQIARDRMTSANLKLAFFHAKKFRYCGEPLDDLAQEGNLGLLKAVDRYDWRRGFRFSTYATWWIRQHISRYIADKARTIRVPVHVFEKIQRLERLARAFELATGREPTLLELADRMEMPYQKLVALQLIVPDCTPIDELSADDSINIDAFSLPDPADDVNEAQLNQAVDRLVSSLSTKDRREEGILRMRFGIGINEVMTLDEIGTRLHVTRERVRQIEAKALKKLRHPARSESFSRLALGFQTTEGPFVSGQLESAEAAASENAEAAPPHEPNPPPGSCKSTAVERALAHAAMLGVPVEDERDGPSDRIWVNLVEIPDGRHRQLARRLIGLGFEYWPGKGYWR